MEMNGVLRTASYVMIASTHTHVSHCYAHRFFRLLGRCVASKLPAQDFRPTKLHGVQRTASAAIRKVIARPELSCEKPSYSPGPFRGYDLTLSPRNFLPASFSSHSSLFLVIEEAFARQVHSDMKALQPSIFLCKRSLEKSGCNINWSSCGPFLMVKVASHLLEIN